MLTRFPRWHLRCRRRRGRPWDHPPAPTHGESPIAAAAALLSIIIRLSVGAGCSCTARGTLRRAVGVGLLPIAVRLLPGAAPAAGRTALRRPRARLGRQPRSNGRRGRRSGAHAAAGAVCVGARRSRRIRCCLRGAARRLRRRGLRAVVEGLVAVRARDGRRAAGRRAASGRRGQARRDGLCGRDRLRARESGSQLGSDPPRRPAGR